MRFINKNGFIKKFFLGKKFSYYIAFIDTAIYLDQNSDSFTRDCEVME